MSVQEDFRIIAENGLRNLYLQIVDVYTESIKAGVEINSYLLSDFNLGDNPDYEMGLNKTEWAILDFVFRKIDLEIDLTPNVFDSIENVTSFLTKEYDAYGINPPPEGLLQIDYDVKKWWKFATRIQNGYFISTTVFNYDNGKITNNDFTPVSFNPESENTTIDGDLKNYLIQRTKVDYQAYANQNSFNQTFELDQMKDEHFFFLDRGKNSIHFVADANGVTGKVYIRTFFNEFAQKLDGSILEITGVEELKKVPGGIRKNYIVKNMISGIDAFEKYYTAEGPPEPKIQNAIDGLKDIKRIIKSSIKKEKITLESRISFIFDNDYIFLSCLDAENNLIDNYELYEFLRDNTELNKYLARLNSINCQLVGDTPPTVTTTVGNPPNDYQHFVTTNKSYKTETPEQKAINFQADRNSFKFIGDMALQIIFDQIKQLSPYGAAIVDIYQTFLNRVDVFELVNMYAEEIAQEITIPDLRKVYFKVFLESLDITEIIDCVVENAGVPQQTEEVFYPPALDEDGLPNENQEPIVTTIQANKNFELDLKTLLYGKFAYFYNIAKGFESELFDFPTPDPDDKLPNAGDIVQTINNAGADLNNKRENLSDLQQQLDALNQQLESDESGDLDNPIFDQVIAKESEIEAIESEVAAAEQAYLDAESTLEDFSKNFAYILMVPPSQTNIIYNTITTNDPQYKYKSDLINQGMIEARDNPLFTPETFIPTLFKIDILKYADSLTDIQFQDFYDNIAEKNKKLKTSSEIKKDAEEGLNSQEEIGKVAKTNKSTTPKPINFSSFDFRYPTFSFEPLFSQLLQNAYDDSIRKALGPLTNASKLAMDNGFNGNEDSFGRLDPEIKAEYLSNDLTQNLLDGLNGIFNSPLEIYIRAQKEVFPNNSIEDIICLFDKIYSEIPVQLQLKLLSGTVNNGDTSLLVIKNIFAGCVGDDSFTLITSFFVWLRGAMEQSAGINELLQKVEDARKAALLNTDICDANENLDSILDQNASREAIQSLTEVLSLLGDEKRNSLIPNIFGCAGNTNKKPVFDDFFGPGTKDSLNKQVKGDFESINSLFNLEIDKFKPIILKQNLTPANLFTQVFGEGDDAQRKTLQGFFKNVDIMLQGGTADPTEVDNLERAQKSLQQVILENIKTNELLGDFNVVESQEEGSGYVSYGIILQNFIYTVVLVQDEDITFKNLQLLADTVNIIVTKKDVDQEEEVLYSTVLEGFFYADLVERYKQLVLSYSPLVFSSNTGDSRNHIVHQEYTYELEPNYDKYFTQKLIEYLKFGPDYNQGNKQLLELIFKGLAEDYVLKLNLFDDNNFINIPLKDFDAEELGRPGGYRTNYVDGGLMLFDELFENYKNQRSNYQCFTNFEANPDAHQVSNLKSLYESLFNVLIIEGLMRQFFSLGSDLLLSKEEFVKLTVIEGIPETFNTSVTRIGDLSQSYKADIDLLYKFSILEEKQAAGPTLGINQEEPESWNLTQLNKKIEYLALKYYDILIDRLKTRISLSVENFGEEDIFNRITYLIDNGKIFEMYDQDQDVGEWPPRLTGLRKGLFLQRYVDVRQRGGLLRDIEKDQVGSDLSSREVISEYLPFRIQNALDPEPHGVEYPIEPGKLLAPEPFIAEPVYTNFFFTKFPEEGRLLDPIFPGADGRNTPVDFADYVDITAAPEVSFTGTGPDNEISIKGDIDEERNYVGEIFDQVSTQNEYNPAPTYAQQWRTKFVRSQGKINYKDFKYTYRFLQYNNEDVNNKNDTSGAAASLNYEPFTAYANNGPFSYFYKMKAGIRLCISVPKSEIPQDLIESYAAIRDKLIVSFSATTEARELAKEKVGEYTNELGEEFYVIPLYSQDVDFLPFANSMWKMRKDMIEELIIIAENDNVPDPWENLVYESMLDINWDVYKENLLTTWKQIYPQASYFSQLLPLVIQEVIDDNYGDQISNMFNLTKKEIIDLIVISKAVIDGEWDFDLDKMSRVTNVPGFSATGGVGDITDPAGGQDFKQGVGSEFDAYLPIVLSIIPVLIQYLATFTDPTWKTPWYSPGPVTALGFMAKILSIVQSAQSQDD